MRGQRRSKLPILFFGVLGTLSAQALGILDPALDPLSQEWGRRLEKRFAKLPEEGHIPYERMPWTDYTYPAREGGIARRNFARESDDRAPAAIRAEALVNKRDLLGVSYEKRTAIVAGLSLAEKFDIARDRYDFPLYHEALKDAYSRRETDDSLQLGWAIASTLYLEPQAVSLPSENIHDAITVGFTSSDVKGLLAYYFTHKAGDALKKFQVGSDCRGVAPEKCPRLGALPFHLLLTNTVGGKKEAMILDKYSPDGRLDLRAVVGYETDIRPRTDGSYLVHLSLQLSREPLARPVGEALGFINFDTEEEAYDYVLEVDTNGELARGRFLSPNAPRMALRAEFTGKLPDSLDRIVKQATIERKVF